MDENETKTCILCLSLGLYPEEHIAASREKLRRGRKPDPPRASPIQQRVNITARVDSDAKPQGRRHQIRQPAAAGAFGRCCQQTHLPLPSHQATSTCKASAGPSWSKHPLSKPVRKHTSQQSDTCTHHGCCKRLLSTLHMNTSTSTGVCFEHAGVREP